MLQTFVELWMYPIVFCFGMIFFRLAFNKKWLDEFETSLNAADGVSNNHYLFVGVSFVLVLISSI